ncbi:class I SAM-dependent methyltransferase [Bradyrhizobium iriomotense]|uniref:class I SAM-dependent methyltransferase n=1 Tax=Bradyrhizobium iriomotense TaxID=441950 RepID=UPI001B8A4025|nr:rRNA adenine N-6-methyltransferase family protein [Bradyrhizobium iriomotense]MBR1127892.1 SAM-dependent methyltransferase [Bradyrhizobium iriomotense]
MPNDFLSFFLSWMSSPRRVGAVAPSGAALADLITREISATTGPILELGPGTGAFTYKLLKRGVRPQDLTLIEYGSDFMKLLQMRFPGSRVLWMDAARLAAERLYDGAPVGAVVSGLPLLNMSRRKVMSILSGAFSYVRPGGAFYQFTYGMSCPVPRPVLDRLGLRAKLVDRALLNVPPAAVYRLTRRPQMKLVTGSLAPEPSARVALAPMHHARDYSAAR